MNTERHSAKVILESGNSFNTTMNASKEDIKQYYLGKLWNMSTVEEETAGITKYDKCIDVVFLS